MCQARSVSARGQLILATTRLLREQSFADLSVAAIAREAQVPVGTVYQRFPSKQDLLWAAGDRFLQDLELRLCRLRPGSTAAPGTVGARETAGRKYTSGLEVGLLVKCVYGAMAARPGVAIALLADTRRDQLPASLAARLDTFRSRAATLLDAATLPGDAAGADHLLAVRVILTQCREEISLPAAQRSARFTSLLAAAVRALLVRAARAPRSRTSGRDRPGRG